MERDVSTGERPSTEVANGNCSFNSPSSNIVLLAIAWALTLSTSTLLTTVGPLSATELGASKSLAAFTVGMFLIGAAVSSVPSGWIFRKYGRFVGFAVGCFCQLVGSLLGTLAMYSSELTWLYLGCLSIGLAQGLGQFYRFSAVEISPPDLKSSAITYVLSGGVIAAFLGPTAADYTIDLIGKDYVGSYMIIALFALLNLVVIYLVNFPPLPSLQNFDSKASSSSTVTFKFVEIRPTREIIVQSLFILSCTIATLAHTIMIMLMSNVTVDMHDHGYSFRVCSLVLELHFVAMFSPGFFTGKLIGQYGSFIVAMIGGFLFTGSAVILAIGTAEWNYIVGMILVGVAWNLSFSAGTVMLTSSYKPQEATSVQAVNDFVLFTVAGAGSLISGEIYSDFGWLVLIYLVSALMLVYLLLFVFTLKRRKEFTEGYEALIPAGEENDNMVEATMNPVTREHGQSFSEFVNDGRKRMSSPDYGGVHRRSIDVRDPDTSDIENADEYTPLRSLSVA